MGEGVARRHTLSRRAEDAEELEPPRAKRGPPWVERGWTPLLWSMNTVRKSCIELM